MRALLLILSVLTRLFVQAQSYSVLPELDFDHSSICGIVSTDSCYYVLGSVWTYEDPQDYLFVGRMSFEGELTQISTPLYLERSLRPWDDLLLLNNNGNLVFGGQVVDEETIAGNAFIMEVTPNFEELFFTEFDNPHFPAENFFRPNSIVQDDENNYLIVSTVSTGVDNEGSQVLLVKTDASGEFMWSAEYGDTFNSDRVSDVLVLDEGYLLGGIQTNEQYVDINVTFKPLVLYVDKESGTLINEIELDTTYPFYSISEMRQIDDQFIACGNTAYETIQAPFNSTINYSPYACSFSLNGDINWEVEFTGEADFICEWSNIELTNSNSILLAGTRPPTVEEYTGMEPFLNGFLASLTPDGIIQWTNLFHHPIETDMFMWNFVYDLTWNEENGMTGVGFVRDYTNNWQRAWVFNVDEDGCVVSDCPTAVSELSVTRENFLDLFPNPAREFVNVSLELDHHSTGCFQLYSVLGELIWYSEQQSLSQGKNTVRIILPRISEDSYTLLWVDKKHNEVFSATLLIK